jgi:hypothetical protein
MTVMAEVCERGHEYTEKEVNRFLMGLSDLDCDKCITQEQIIEGEERMERGQIIAVQRRTHCKKCGREFTPENTYIVSNAGARRCKGCVSDRQKARYHRSVSQVVNKSGWEYLLPAVTSAKLAQYRYGLLSPVNSKIGAMVQNAKVRCLACHTYFRAWSIARAHPCLFEAAFRKVTGRHLPAGLGSPVVEKLRSQVAPNPATEYFIDFEKHIKDSYAMMQERDNLRKEVLTLKADAVLAEGKIASLQGELARKTEELLQVMETARTNTLRYRLNAEHTAVYGK